MSKYKVGDKVVMKIISADKDEIKTYSVSGVNNDWRWCLPQNLLERYIEPLSAYTEPLEAKNRRQAAEITRLLAENKELKDKLDNRCDMCIERHEKEVEQARAEGQNEAWSLCNEICKRRKMNEIQDMFNHLGINEFCQLFDRPYSEIAEKFAQWEKAKEEIKVGDIVRAENIHGTDGIVTCVDGCNITLMLNSGVAVYRNKNACYKTGRHIDIDSFLKQIGGEQE